MADLVVHSENIARRLLDLARRENRSVEAVLETLLDTYSPEEPSETEGSEPQPGTFAALAKSAEEAGIRSDKPVDTASRSREILNAEFADYVRRNQQDEQSSTGGQ